MHYLQALYAEAEIKRVGPCCAVKIDYVIVWRMFMGESCINSDARHENWRTISVLGKITVKMISKQNRNQTSET